MSVKATFNNKEYELIYNEQSGFYEIELEAPKIGGVYNTEITFKDLIENIETSTRKIQIWAKEKNINVSQKTLVYFLSKIDLEIKDVIEFENYEYVIDEETNKNTIFNIMKKINADNGDIVVLQRNSEIDYIGIIKDIEKSISDEKEREIVLKKVSELSFMYMDVIDRISNVNSERMDDIEKHQDKLDEKIGKVKDTVDLIKKDIYEDEDYDFEIVCPYCNHEFVADIEDELKEEIECPECHNKIELDWDGEDDDCCSGGCCGCGHHDECGCDDDEEDSDTDNEEKDDNDDDM